MGSFSWLFADTNNTKKLRANKQALLEAWEKMGA